MHATGQALTVVVTIGSATDDLNPRTLGSLLRQTSADWRLLVIHPRAWGGPEDLDFAAPVADGLVQLNAVDNHKVAAEVYDSAVTTPLVAFLPRRAFLEPHAIDVILSEFDADPEVDLVYSDADVVDEWAVPVWAERLPEWSPQLLRGYQYLRGFVALRTELVRSAGGYRFDLGALSDYDLALRVAEQHPVVVHVPTVLLHRTDVAGAEPGQIREIVQAHYERMGLNCVLSEGAYPGVLVAHRNPGPAKASIVIPTRGGHGSVRGRQRRLVEDAVRSILEHKYVVDYEIVIVHDEQADRHYIEQLAALAGDRLVVVDFPGPFNFSAKVNLGAKHASGDVLILLNDDVEVLTDSWLDQLVAIAQEPDVGAVGAKLLFEDGSIQHAGLMFHAGQFQHVGFHLPDVPGPRGLNIVDREVVGVTAACMVIRKRVWQELGGMDETLPNNFNDVDLCWRLRAKGYRIVQANSVLLHHFESMSRQPHVADWEASRILGRLRDQVHRPDPYTFPEPGEAVSPGRRPLREWARVSVEVWRTEGGASFMRKARRRIGR